MSARTLQFTTRMPSTRRAVAGWQRRKTLRLLGRTCCAALIVSVAAAIAQDPPAARRPPDQQPGMPGPVPEGASDCRRCHTCDRPTPENRCLPECTRSRMLAGGAYLPEYEGPDVIILDAVGGTYLPVPFDHKGHAKMAEMTLGCVACHHYTPAGQPHPACKTCHDVSSADASIRKPGLRGAYHRQCLNCHREWINEKDCAVCHRKKVGSLDSNGQIPRLTKDDILAQMHPPVPEPENVVYGDKATQGKAWQVVFDHQEHVARFGLNCVDCHHEPSCSRCHTREHEQPQFGRLGEHHWPCSRCHKRDIGPSGTCERCHRQEGRARPEAFEHAQTGWPLGRFHQSVVCRDCHASVPFVKLDRDCNGCHAEWDAETFDHRVTGQGLDENHAEIECEVCHVERDYERPPVCGECHEEDDEGIAFPAKRPGPYPVLDSAPDEETLSGGPGARGQESKARD